MEDIKMKRKITFKDKDKNIFNIDVEIKEGRFSMSGDCGSSSGQCLDSINPKNEDQKKLVELWHKWHLNDMKSGTPKQEKAVNEWMKKNNITNYDYTKSCEYLKSINLYEVIHESKPYKYGHGWLKRKLPSNIEEETNAVCDSIEKIEQEEKGDYVLVSEAYNMTQLQLKQDHLENIEDYSDEIIALAIHLELTTDELEDIDEEDDNRFIHGGINYYVGTEEEMEKIAVSYLTDDDYLWKSAVEAGSTTEGLEEWAEEVINVDGIGHILNGWDGTEDQEEINGTWYTICRN